MSKPRPPVPLPRLAPALVALAALAALSGGAGAQSVLVVDAGGGGAFTELQRAVDAASPGDTVLVRSGQYTDVTVAKAISLVADAGASVRVQGSVTVADLAAGTSARVHGIAAVALGFPAVPTPVPALVVRDCAGAVWVEDCSFTGGTGVFVPGHGARLAGSGAVVLQDTTVVGGTLGGDGLVVVRAAVQVFGGSSTGGTGSGFGGLGGTGLDATDATVYLQSAAVRGGRGAAAGPLGGGCIQAGDGGDGLRLQGASAVARAVASTFTGGAGGAGFSFCAPGQPGEAVVVLGGTFVPSLAPVGLHLEADPVAREGGRVVYTITGEAGDAVLLAFAAAPAPVFVPLISAPFLLDPATLVGIPLGVLPPGGTRVVPTTVPELGPGVQVVSWSIQVLGLSVTAGPLGGDGQALTLLDGSF